MCVRWHTQQCDFTISSWFLFIYWPSPLFHLSHQQPHWCLPLLYHPERTNQSTDQWTESEDYNRKDVYVCLCVSVWAQCRFTLRPVGPFSPGIPGVPVNPESPCFQHLITSHRIDNGTLNTHKQTCSYHILTRLTFSPISPGLPNRPDKPLNPCKSTNYSRIKDSH